MDAYNYIIIGGGMAADSAVQGIRSLDQSGSIAIISQELDPPYDRPPLTKGLWFGKEESSIDRHTVQNHVKLFLGKTVTSIDPSRHTVTDEEGHVYHYQKLLLASGGTPHQLTCPNAGVIYMRTLADYRLLRSLYDKGNDFVVIGGGFIGTEIAAALAMNGKNVSLIIRESSIGYNRFPIKFSKFLNAYFTEHGVKLLTEQHVNAITHIHSKWKVTTNHGEAIFADGVIAGLGITPNTELAQAIGIPVDNGIIVDEYLKTSVDQIWAAGDAANFYSPHLQKRVRIEHEDAANSMGKAAGRNMAGANEPFTYLPFFYSDLFELGYEAIGEISSEMEMIEEWTELYREGTIYYLKEGRLRGAVVVGIPDQIPKIRSLIAEGAKIEVKKGEKDEKSVGSRR